MQKLFILILVLCFGTIGCAGLGLKPPPSVCDNLAQGESLFCEIAQKNGIHLETTANLFLFANFAAIDAGAYSAKDAIKVLGDIRYAASFEARATDLVRIVRDVFKANSNLAMAGIMIISPYLSYVDVPDALRPKDRDMLIKWIDDQISLLK